MRISVSIVDGPKPAPRAAAGAPVHDLRADRLPGLRARAAPLVDFRRARCCRVLSAPDRRGIVRWEGLDAGSSSASSTEQHRAGVTIFTPGWPRRGSSQMPVGPWHRCSRRPPRGAITVLPPGAPPCLPDADLFRFLGLFRHGGGNPACCSTCTAPVNFAAPLRATSMLICGAAGITLSRLARRPDLCAAQPPVSGTPWAIGACS